MSILLHDSDTEKGDSQKIIKKVKMDVRLGQKGQHKVRYRRKRPGVVGKK
jgi:hypothetical protein